MQILMLVSFVLLAIGETASILNSLKHPTYNTQVYLTGDQPITAASNEKYYIIFGCTLPRYLDNSASPVAIPRSTAFFRNLKGDVSRLDNNVQVMCDKATNIWLLYDAQAMQHYRSNSGKKLLVMNPQTKKFAFIYNENNLLALYQNYVDKSVIGKKIVENLKSYHHPRFFYKDRDE